MNDLSGESFPSILLFQIEIESCVYLQSSEAVVQGKIAPVIIICTAYKRGSRKVFTIVIYYPCP